jgi:hypothetical protein
VSAKRIYYLAARDPVGKLEARTLTAHVLFVFHRLQIRTGSLYCQNFSLSAGYRRRCDATAICNR